MWNDGEEVNQNGERVKLYLPIQSSPRKTHTAPQESHIGGHCFFSDITPTCDKCQSAMFLLVQLRLERLSEYGFTDDDGNMLDRYLCLFVCPRDECFGSLTFDEGFSSGGQGVVKCLQKIVPVNDTEKRLPSVSAPPTKSSWYTEAETSQSGYGDDNDDNEWVVNDNGKSNSSALANLEDAVTAMEQTLDEDGAFASSSSKSGSHQHNRKHITKCSPSEALDSAFGCYLLKVQNEPPPPQPLVEEDDVGLTESDEKIRNMLARYMAEEEDEEILAALRGSNFGEGGGSMEEDERLSEEARILLGFQDRLRRAPRQVVRYAPGGKPLWSIRDTNRKSKERNLWTLPVCPRSGDKLSFVFQVLPSVLEILDVDKYAGNSAKPNGGDQSHSLDDLMSNGMNFGSIAVFTTANSSSWMDGMDTFLVIQESVDDMPEKGRRNGANGAIEFPSATIAVVEDLDDDVDFLPDG